MKKDKKQNIRCLIRGRNGYASWHEVKDNQPFLVLEELTAKELTMPKGYEIDGARTQIVPTLRGFERILVFNEGNPIALDHTIPTIGLDAIKVGLLVGPLVARIKMMGLNARDESKKFPLDWKIMLLGAAVVIVVGAIGGHYLWPTPHTASPPVEP